MKVRESKEEGVYVEGLQWVLVNDFDEFEKVVSIGVRNKALSHTHMSLASSRGHTVVKVVLHRTWPGSGGTEVTGSNYMQFVDLAGSEKTRFSSGGRQLKESININKSIVWLSHVIKALAEGSKSKSSKKHFVPYRNSQLTRVLQETLGGDCKTVFLATLSPADSQVDESLSTLEMVEVAKEVKNRVKKKEKEDF